MPDSLSMVYGYLDKLNRCHCTLDLYDDFVLSLVYSFKFFTKNTMLIYMIYPLRMCLQVDDNYSEKFCNLSRRTSNCSQIFLNFIFINLTSFWITVMMKFINLEIYYSTTNIKMGEEQCGDYGVMVSVFDYNADVSSSISAYINFYLMLSSFYGKQLQTIALNQQ